MQQPDPTPLLEYRDWQIGFPTAAGEEHKAVRDLNFSLAPGASLGLVGESGSGKSLTALSAIQLLPASAVAQGELIWKGEENLAITPEERLRALRARHIGMIFQEPLSSLNPLMVCGEQVAETLRLHFNKNAKLAEEETKVWFLKVGLREPDRIYQSFPHQLSGGQRQRVMIAMALCTGPELLIADEPTTALDVTVQKEILDLIKRLQAELGIAILFISHDLGVIREVTDEVLVMWKGQVVEQGQVSAVLDNPQHPYTQGLVACRPGVAGDRYRLPTVPDFLERSPEEIEEFLTSLQQQSESKEAVAEAPVVLSAQQVHVRYPKGRNWLGQVKEYHQAVKDVSFQLRRGECLGIVGESGSGKTTLGKSIVHLVPLQSGSVYFNEVALHELSEREFRPLRPDIQMIFQDPFSSLNPKLRIRDLLTEPLQLHAPDLNAQQREERVLEVLQQVKLAPDVLERYPKAFSGGQRQRIGIARALLFKPSILICDESVSALDVSVQAQVLNLLKDLQETYAFSMLFISHDLGVIRFIADRVLVMQEGQVVEQAPVATIFDQPQKAYTKQLLSAVLR
ncbi:MAG: ABC transporter ATP-binding protein [Bacteroidota bacterium]